MRLFAAALLSLFAAQLHFSGKTAEFDPTTRIKSICLRPVFDIGSFAYPFFVS